VIDMEAALQSQSSVLHEQNGTNLLAEFSVAKGDVDAAMAAAPHRIKRRFYHHRYAAIPMECRGVAAAMTLAPIR